MADRFARAFAQYEAGRLDATVAAGIRGASSPALAASLLQQPARVPPGAASRVAAEPQRVLLSSLGEPAGQTSATVLRRDGSSIVLHLTHGPRGWQVTRLRPGAPAAAQGVELNRGALSGASERSCVQSMCFRFTVQSPDLSDPVSAHA